MPSVISPTRGVRRDHAPVAVDDERRIGLVAAQDLVDRLADRAQLGRAELALSERRRVAGGQQQPVALAQRHVELLGETQHHLLARLRAAGLEKAQVARGDARLERQPELAEVTPRAPVAQQRADGGERRRVGHRFSDDRTPPAEPVAPPRRHGPKNRFAPITDRVVSSTLMTRSHWSGLGASLIAAILIAALLPALASAHVERASYWPDPAPDCGVKPCAGGAVPTPKHARIGARRQRDEGRLPVRLARRARSSRSRTPRPTATCCARRSRSVKITAAEAKSLLRLNKKLCKNAAHYSSIQAAVTASGNNDRVVIMPGLYTEPTSREAPTHDPACAQYRIDNDHGADGRGLLRVPVPLPQRPEPDRRHRPRARATTDRRSRRSRTATASPTSGRASAATCRSRARASPDDVTIDAGRVAVRRRPRRSSRPRTSASAPTAPTASCSATSRSATPTSTTSTCSRPTATCSTASRPSTRGEYGVLTFVEDHGLMENCEARATATRACTRAPAPTRATSATRASTPKFRYSQEIRNCDSHHNTSGYSGTDGNATHVARQQLLRQRARLHDRRLHGARVTRASRRTRT